MSQLRIGLLLNPVAGIGGTVALKGSDSIELRKQAIQRGGRYQAVERCRAFLAQVQDALGPRADEIHWVSISAPMGYQCFLTEQNEPYPAHQVEQIDLGITPTTGDAVPTTAQDTRRSAVALLERGIDLLVFVGGDGTARDICAALGERLPVLGVPAGVKMHSGVFAVTPRTAALLVAQLVLGGFVAPVRRDVRDYDEASAADEIRVKTFGQMCVPEMGGYLQQTKVGGRESEPVAVEEICADVLTRVPDARDLVIGPGSTCLAIKQALGMAGTLRGVDVRKAGGTLIPDASAMDLESVSGAFLIVSFTRGQGFLFGRGNQQLSHDFLNSLDWPADVMVVGTRTKLNSLEQRPLLLDTGDNDLDARLSGLVEVITGYEDSLLYRVSAHA